MQMDYRSIQGRELGRGGKKMRGEHKKSVDTLRQDQICKETTI